ncbi:MAG TPA: phospholipase D-like domain-containing protein [Candidatus Limnocylindrales bacterium]|nr:phospholipase D-like domain-containing protein [Candidatus Limnocylindrales bacterium]
MLETLATIVGTLVVVFVAINLSRPEKKIQRRMEPLFGTEDEQLEREMGALLGPAILAGNRIEALQNGDEIFPAMLSAIADARRTITLETYIYWSGEIGRRFAEALTERARAGVRVHVMLDWLGSARIDKELLDMMSGAGVEVERYHPLRWYNLGRLNNRTHRKVMLVDGAVGFTGGVGIADQWTGHAQDAEHWRDIHFRVRGPVVAQMQAAFLDNWIKSTGRVLHGIDYFPPLREEGTLKAHLFMSSPAGGSESMRLMYLTAITAARRSIDIASAYFVPDQLMSEELLRARERGVRIRIILPDRHIDAVTVGIASKRAWGPLLEGGVEIHEYEPTMFHCKMLIFDRRVVSAGSTNFDMRSFELNDEASLNVYDSVFAEEMTAVFERDLARTRKYTYRMWKQRPLRQKLSEIVIAPIRSQL